MYTDATAITHRAETVWPLNSVPYDMDADADCSAFASAVLGIPRQNTVTLVTGGYIRPLAAGEQLEPGDFIGLCGPGTEGANGHIAVVVAVFASGAFSTIEQHGPDGFLGPDRLFYPDIPDGFLPYRVTARQEDEMVLEIPRDEHGTMWISRDRIDRRPLYYDEDVLYFLGRGALVPDQPNTAGNGAPCVADIRLFGVDISGATSLHDGGPLPTLDPDQLATKVAESVGDELAARLARKA